MESILEFFNNLTSPDWIMQNGGMYFVLLIVFIETGLFFGFFLPGDPLLFISGMIIANSSYPFDTSVLNLVFWIMLIATSGIIGNFAGYWFGRKSERWLSHRKDTWLFKKKYIFRAKEFYEKNGGGAIVLARFLPLIRTFAPIVAGMVQMKMSRFTFYNIVGSILWASSIVSAGYLLGDNAWAKDNLEKIIIGIVLLSTGPVLLKLIFGKKKEIIEAVPVKPVLKSEMQELEEVS
ncbi:MAG: VTT domain-containing protein [Ginsengibacter sp.]|jgi:membrane-associated protein